MICLKLGILDLHMNHNSVIGSWLTCIAAGLESYAINAEEFFARHGVDYKEETSPNSRLPISTINRIWKDAVRVTGDELFGLKVGSLVTPQALNVLGIALWSVRTIREHMECFVRYKSVLASDDGPISIAEEDGCLVTTFVIRTNEAGKPIYTDYETDAVCATLLTLRRAIYKKDFCPAKMELPRQAPPDTETYEKFFGCPVIYNQSKLRVFVSLEDADRLIPGSSPDLARATTQMAQDYISRFDTLDSTLLDVRKALTTLLPQGKGTLECVTDLLNTSKRTLHRKLRQRNTTFREILDTYRKEMALAYIEQNSMTFGDISFLLGFSSSSNFTRSFKKWTGMTPLEYKKSEVIQATKTTVPPH